MRDPERIEPTLAAIEELWRCWPDMRLGQLISNIAGAEDRDVFYIEDDQLLGGADRIRIEGWELRHAQPDEAADAARLWRSIPDDRKNPWHTLTVLDDGWYLAHPIFCDLHHCDYNLAIFRYGQPPVSVPGTYQWDDDGIRREGDGE